MIWGKFNVFEQWIYSCLNIVVVTQWRLITMQQYYWVCYFNRLWNSVGKGSWNERSFRRMFLNVLFVKVKHEFRVLWKPSKYTQYVQCMFNGMAQSYDEYGSSSNLLILPFFSGNIFNTSFSKPPNTASWLQLLFLSV